MTATPLPDTAAPVGPPVPFDPELAPGRDQRGPAARRVRRPRHPVSAAGRHAGRGRAAPERVHSRRRLRRRGAHRARARRRAGHHPAICRPTGPPPHPVIYHTHGGGMITGDKRGGVPELLELIDGMGKPWYPSSTGSPRGPTPARRRLLRRTGVDRRPRDGTRHRPGPDHRRRSQRRRRPRRRPRPHGRDRRGPALLAQMLMYPMLDDRDTPSAHQMAGLASGIAPPTRRAGTPCWARHAEPTPSRPTPRPPAPPTCPACRPPSSTSAPPRPSATRSSPTPAASGRPEATPNSTSGPAPSTASTSWPPRQPSPRTPAPPAARGCAGSYPPPAVTDQATTT